jgi:G:T-mismatch repair DNA endonuclease (very short patch repair protein)
MSDMFAPEERSRIMGRIRSRGNRTTELRFVRLLRQFHIQGWRRGSKLPGRPDFVFYRHRDRCVNSLLRSDGWRVLRIWESSLRRSRAAIARLRLMLNSGPCDGRPQRGPSKFRTSASIPPVRSTNGSEPFRTP